MSGPEHGSQQKHQFSAFNYAVVLAEKQQQEGQEFPEEVAGAVCLFFYPPPASASCTFRFDSALHHSQYKWPISHSSHASPAQFFLTSLWWKQTFATRFLKCNRLLWFFWFQLQRCPSIGGFGITDKPTLKKKKRKTIKTFDCSHFVCNFQLPDLLSFRTKGFSLSER